MVNGNKIWNTVKEQLNIKKVILMKAIGLIIVNMVKVPILKWSLLMDKKKIINILDSLNKDIIMGKVWWNIGMVTNMMVNGF